MDMYTISFAQTTRATHVLDVSIDADMCIPVIHLQSSPDDSISLATPLYCSYSDI